MPAHHAIIVGASRGIGLALVHELASRGYRVIATERSHGDALHDLADRHGSVAIASCDVTRPDSWQAVAERLESPTDLLILNAGVYGPKDQSLAALDRDNVADMVMVNAVGPIQLALALLPRVREGGTIGMMTSKMGSIDDSSGGVNLYRISKVAQNMLARSLFEHHAKARQVGVLSLHPGWVRTDMGGANAPVEPAASARGLVEVLESEDAPRHAFLAYDGTPIPW
jgi:NAD(P)-dependent dehydrogenase (short-subunit alcohol dehydrogenase family)